MKGDKFLDDIGDITFIGQENLNNDLANYVKKYSFSQQEIQFIVDHRKENITSIEIGFTDARWTDTALRYVEENEAFLLKMLKRLGFNYDGPSRSS